MKISSKSPATMFNPSGPVLEWKRDRHWSDNAACQDHAALFDAAYQRFYPAQQAICATCPVAAECLDEALRAEGNDAPGYRATIRGGLTPLDRYELHQARKVA